MEPKSPTPRFESENPTVSYETKVETAPTQLTPEFTQSVERGGERIEQRSDNAIAQQAATTVLPPPLPLPIVDEPAVAPATDASPLVAGDEDLIEKEWVDRAKHIIEQTKDDPYRREQEINKLQADYLRKRYGRELGAPQ
jgi:hypothetical protein